MSTVDRSTPAFERPQATPIARVPLGNEAAVVLREAILDGRLVQGERVNEVHISRMLGISRGPLREALRSLERDGLVTTSPYRGASIIEVTPDDVMDVLSVRKLLEPHAVTSAIERAHGSLVLELRSAAEQMLQMAAAGDAVGVAGAHGRYHAAFYRQSGNQLLARLWSRLEDPVRLYLLRRQSMFGDMSEIAGAHQALLEAVEAGDSAGAVDEVISHLTVNIRTVAEALSSDEQAAADGSSNQAHDD